VEDWGSAGWSGARLYLADLASDRPSLRAVPLGIPPLPKTEPTLAFCPAGDCLLLAQDEALTLYDLPSGKSRWTAPPLRGRWIEPVVFHDRELLRAYRRWNDGTTSTIEIVTVRLRDGSQQPTGRLEAPQGAWLRPSVAGERLLVLHHRISSDPAQARPLRKATLHDGVTGALLRTLAENVADVDADFLTDGRIALAEIREGAGRLRVLGRDGTEGRSIDLGPLQRASLEGEPEPGRLFLGLGACPMFLPVDLRGRPRRRRVRAGHSRAECLSCASPLAPPPRPAAFPTRTWVAGGHPLPQLRRPARTTRSEGRNPTGLARRRPPAITDR